MYLIIFYYCGEVFRRFRFHLLCRLCTKIVEVKLGGLEYIGLVLLKLVQVSPRNQVLTVYYSKLITPAAKGKTSIVNYEFVKSGCVR